VRSRVQMSKASAPFLAVRLRIIRGQSRFEQFDVGVNVVDYENCCGHGELPRLADELPYCVEKH
jgi:hypothetical protein